MKPYSQFFARHKYTIKIGTEVVGTSNPGDIFFSDLHVEDDELYHLALTDIIETTGRCWLLTDEDNEAHEELATAANFQCLGPGVWLREVEPATMDV
jgi:hypothetical protein